MRVLKPRATPTGSVARTTIRWPSITSECRSSKERSPSGETPPRCGKNSKFVPGRQLDPDGRFLRSRVASHRQDTQPRAACNLQAETLDDRGKGGICVSDPHA